MGNGGAEEGKIPRAQRTTHHHNPDLVILDDSGNENERIDLNGYTEAKLERLLQSKGVKKRM